jgi:hypothetical protein
MVVRHPPHPHLDADAADAVLGHVAAARELHSVAGDLVGPVVALEHEGA